MFDYELYGFHFNLESLFHLFICIGVGILGTLARLLIDVKNVEIRLIDIIAECMIIVFFSTMIYLVWTLLKIMVQIAFLVSGTTGFYGRKVFERFLKDKTGIDVSEDNKN